MSVGLYINGVAQDISYAIKIPDQIQDPTRLKNACKVAKIVTIATAVSVIAAAVFVGFFVGCPFGVLIAAPVGLLLYESYTMTDNIQRIAEKKERGDRIPFPFTSTQIANNVARGTILSRLIISLIPRKCFT